MSVDIECLDEKLEGRVIARLSVDTSVVAESEPSSVTSSEPPSPSPFNESDILATTVTRTQSEIYARDSMTPTTTASTSSLPIPSSTPTMNVKFAPLPAIGPRKRRSNQPLGMAARAQLVRRRRGLQAEDHQIIQQDGEDVVIVSNSVWTSPEFEEQRRRVEILAARHAQVQANNAALEVEDILNQPDDEEKPRKKRSTHSAGEEPVYSLRKMVKGAGLTLWKRVSSKDIAAMKERGERLEDGAPKKSVETIRQRRKSDPERPMAPILRRTATPPPPLPALRPGLGRLNSEPIAVPDSASSTPIQSTVDVCGLVQSNLDEEVEGGVWEEEIGDAFRRNPLQLHVSDTATILADLTADDDNSPQETLLPPIDQVTISESPSRPQSPPLPSLPESTEGPVATDAS
ncbi:hypothetical protein CPB83DRAFT_890514 [Crepidotus variabilis]|uniref:Uncharacterized protein n=1 Tax=Crepidotus variabilis TaxID=179855 RepID=A0A9P6JTW6_9AGAR|nr:hypothetical protein CPB83DRAFT_890514 [Crepidotus variabilis]